MLMPFGPKFDDLPETLPIFPLGGVVLLPKGDLPLNLFERQHIAMVDGALKEKRMIGMVQPIEGACSNGRAIFKTGCAGRITGFSETDDGHYLVTLRGVCRFHILEELAPHQDGFRQVVPNWLPFRNDLNPPVCLDLDRSSLVDLLGEYLAQQDITIEWSLLDNLADEHLMTALAMVCPFSSSEKQALLEAPCCSARANLFLSLLEMSVRHFNAGGVTSNSPH